MWSTAYEKGSGDLSARLRAGEEQALIDGMRSGAKGGAAPAAELSTEEIYEDWRLQPAREALEEAARKYEKALEDEEVQKEIYEASEEFWAENGILQTVGLSEAQDGEMLDFHADFIRTYIQEMKTVIRMQWWRLRPPGRPILMPAWPGIDNTGIRGRKKQMLF